MNCADMRTKGPLTLVYSAKDEERNQAVVLNEVSVTRQYFER